MSETRKDDTSNPISLPRKVVPYSEFREKKREQLYGDPKKRLRGRGYPDDFSFGPDDR